MKLKDIFKAHKVAILGGAGVLLVVGAVLLWAWFSAPSTVNTKKADDLSNQATVLQANANTAETVANVYAAERVEARKETTQSKVVLRNRKADYEKARTNNSAVNRDDLDRRERQLQSDLSNLYPANR